MSGFNLPEKNGGKKHDSCLALMPAAVARAAPNPNQGLHCHG